MINGVALSFSDVIQLKKPEDERSEHNPKPLLPADRLKHRTANDVVELSLLGKKALLSKPQSFDAKALAEELWAKSDLSKLSDSSQTDAPFHSMERLSQAMEELSQAMDGYLGLDEEYSRTKLAVRQFDRLRRTQDYIDKLENVTPVPAVELSADEAEEIKAKIKAYGTWNESSTEDFVQFYEHKQYTFKVDGRVFVQDEAVPTSMEEKQSWLHDLTSLLEDMKEVTGGKSEEYWTTRASDYEATLKGQTDNLNKAVARVNELRKQGIGSGYTSGQLHDATV